MDKIQMMGKLTIKQVVTDGYKAKAGSQVQAEIEKIAKLPSKETLLARAFGGLKAPISAFARVINQIKEQKEEQGA